MRQIRSECKDADPRHSGRGDGRNTERNRRTAADQERVAGQLNYFLPTKAYPNIS